VNGVQRFADRAAIVTGGGHGIGRAVAEEGASIVVADLDVAAADRVADEIGQRGGVAVSVGLDVTDTASVGAAIDTALNRFGALSVLVNNAGGDVPQPAFPDTEDALWMSLADLNLFGVMRCIRAALPHLIAAPIGGAVVTIGSVNGLAAFGGYPYSATKAGLESLTKNLVAEYGRSGVRFNLIAPGTIRTRVWDNQPDAPDRCAGLYPLGRVGEPEDVAAAVAFLASDDAAWVTGVTLPVDGGILTGSGVATREPVSYASSSSAGARTSATVTKS
jgi:meso-butanediol dehydrogenase/(S,S)-butanediol dehydrogenase/diacetyl reductase